MLIFKQYTVFLLKSTYFANSGLAQNLVPVQRSVAKDDTVVILKAGFGPTKRQQLLE